VTIAADTSVQTQAETPGSTPTARHRRTWAAIIAVLVIWSTLRAGVNLPDLINPRGWGQVQSFFAAMIRPDLSPAFLRLTIEETAVTLSYALLGTALSVVIGIIGGPLLSERLWRPLASEPGTLARWGWRLSRFGFAVPRSMHEIVFGLILLNILGLDPLVAVLAIGVPFGAVTAKVFSELIDEVPSDAERAMRAAGAGRLMAMIFGVVPTALGDLLSYAFYRFECAIRSAAVLGIVGAGGLGFQLALSFQSLRYDQMWTLLWALIAVGGMADWWSSSVRRRRSDSGPDLAAGEGASHSLERDPFLVASAAGGALMIPVAWWWLDLSLSSLWSPRARRLGAELAGDAWPPEVGPGGWSSLIADAADTVALAMLALALAWTFASLLAFVAARRARVPGGPSLLPGRALSWASRFLLLIARSVPPPVWALLAVFVFLPGLWPGVVALAIYQLGVLGRLEGEVVENLDDRPGRALRASGASRTGVIAYATLPAVSTRFVALGLYRWEVTIRDTVIVGVVGAAGLGQRISEQTSSFDYQGILASIAVLIVLTVAADIASAAIRRTLR
jgi:phosphonate transport system permease protein